MTRAPDRFPEVEVLVDRKTGAKQLLVDGLPMEHVKDVSVQFSADRLSEVTVTFCSDRVTVSEAKLPGHGLDP